MRLPVIQGLIRRRLLVNFRVDAEVMGRFLPSPFQVKAHKGYAIAGICLIRLEEVRPRGLPRMVGVQSENAAHRVAVVWQGADGQQREGVYIPRRDTGSRLNHWAGGRVFPGEHGLAKFVVSDRSGGVDIDMKSCDGAMRVMVEGEEAPGLPVDSCFESLQEASDFFQPGSVGYSVTKNGQRLDGIRLKTYRWEVKALAVKRVESTFFADEKVFPKGSVAFDHALIMRDIAHEWHSEPDLWTEPKT